MKLNTQNKSNEKKINTLHTPDNTAMLSVGTPRVETPIAEISNHSPLFSRELANRSYVINNTGNSDNYAYPELIKEEIKRELLIIIDAQIEFLKEENPSYSTEYHETDSFEKLAFQWAEGFDIIRDKSRFHNEYQKSSIQLIETTGLSRSKEIGTEPVRNASICMNTLVLLFQKYWEYNLDRKTISELKLTCNHDDIIVKGIKPLIDQTIRDLEKIKNESYFSIFRILIDPNRDLKAKYQGIQAYLGLERIDLDSFDSEEFIFTELSQAFTHIQDMTCYFNNLQIVLDCLKIIQKHNTPKTIENIKILLKICAKCFQCYQEDYEKIFLLEQFKKNPVPYNDDYFKISFFLNELQKKIQKLINAVMPKKIMPTTKDDWGSNSITTAWKKQNQKNQKPKGKNNKNQLSSKAPKLNVNSQKIDGELNNLKTLETKEELIQTEHTSDSNQFNEFQPIINNSISTKDDSDDESFETIERETNVLMEIFRQMLESDRKKKLERKEAKLLPAKNLESINELPTTVTNTNEPKFIKLSSKNQLTLQGVLQEKPGHLTIKGKAVKKLIIALGGRIEGGGQGSEFNIFWGNSNKQSGKYEVTHGNDSPGYLTSEWASKVAEAIQKGIEFGYIAPETLSQI